VTLCKLTKVLPAGTSVFINPALPRKAEAHCYSIAGVGSCNMQQAPDL